MKTWSFHIMGVASPLPGTFPFHLMLLVSLQAVGGLPLGARPLASGPRHCGQLASAEKEAADNFAMEPSWEIISNRSKTQACRFIYAYRVTKRSLECQCRFNY